MKVRCLSWLGFGAAVCLAFTSCSPPGKTLKGLGATFPAPLYKRWFLEYYKQNPDVRVNYQGIGSGAGIRQFTAGVVDFAASDAAMSPKEVDQLKAQLGVGVQLLPMTAGSIVLCYNLPATVKELRLSRKALVGIFLGEITTWDDPAVAAANEGVPLPASPITVVRRAEGSGTTYAFTNHLSHVSRRWKWGATKDWPLTSMIGARGNPGVAALIQQTPGAIGYLEYGYAELARLPMALIENKAGRYVRATPKSGRAALEGVKLPKDYRIWVPDPPGRKAYPIVTYTWLLCYQTPPPGHDPVKAALLKEVVRFCLTEGQKFSQDLGYIALPKEIAREVLHGVDNIKP
jgi:phosphate transport system substrate-binding protein